MRVLLTGANGQVGRALLACAPRHVSITALTHAELDIADADAVARATRRLAPQVVINTAAYTAVDRAEAEAELARRINASGPRHLAAAARSCAARLVHLSTDYVFDGTSCTPYRPDDAPAPLSVYGRTKLEGEEAVRELLPEHSVILRTAWVYAARGSNFLLTMLRLMRSGGPVRVVADQIGTPTAAAAVAEAVWSIVVHPEISGVHHWTDAGIASWYDFAVAIAEEADARGLLSGEVSVLPIGTRDYPTTARRPPFSVLDRSSLRTLGLPPVHWRQRLRCVLAEIGNG